MKGYQIIWNHYPRCKPVKPINAGISNHLDPICIMHYHHADILCNMFMCYAWEYEQNCVRVLDEIWMNSQWVLNYEAILNEFCMDSEWILNWSKSMIFASRRLPAHIPCFWPPSLTIRKTITKPIQIDDFRLPMPPGPYSLFLTALTNPTENHT